MKGMVVIAGRAVVHLVPHTFQLVAARFNVACSLFLQHARMGTEIKCLSLFSLVEELNGVLQVHVIIDH